MHLALLHDGRPALLRIEGPPGAPVALFFHPFPLYSDVWDEMLRACASAGLCAAALDAPGFGGTPALGEPLSMEHLARLGAAALDALGARSAGIVGCSMGGYAAMAFARLFPKRIRSAVLIATKASADSEEAKAKREQQAKAALERGPAAMTSEMVPKLLGKGSDPKVRAQVEALATRATAQGIADALRGMAARPDSTPDLARWGAPALVIEGAEDQLMPPAELEKLALGIPGARKVTIAGAGHLPFLESPDEVARLLTTHLQLHVRDDGDA
jgi:pimeloyl-ACP methyl ester carboxylesterase